MKEKGWLVLTFTADADFEHPFTQAVPSRHTKTSVVGVLIWGSQYVSRRSEAEGGNPFHLCITYICQMDRPTWKKTSA